jgi:2'-5' RNA ligase
MSTHFMALFIAVVPEVRTATCIYRLGTILKCVHKFQGVLTSRDCLHVTLFFLGDEREHVVQMVCEAAAEVKMEPFEVSFDRTSSFRGKPDDHPFVLLGDNGLQRLRSFRQTLGAALMRKGLKKSARADFTPHITLLRDARKVEEQPIVPICWTVSEFVLIHSDRGHTHRARWTLG